MSKVAAEYSSLKTKLASASTLSFAKLIKPLRDKFVACLSSDLIAAAAQTPGDDDLCKAIDSGRLALSDLDLVDQLCVFLEGDLGNPKALCSAASP